MPIINEGTFRGERRREVLSLRDFVAQYRKSFPLRMRIEDGDYSEDPEESLSAGDVYLVHLVKGTASVLIEGTEMTGYRDITIPATSSVEYGLAYNADASENENLLKGYVAKTAGDVMGLRPMPRVVCATRSHSSGKGSSSVSASEVLVVQEVKRVKLFGQRLKVYSVTEGVAKVLRSDCSGYFSTQPALTKLTMETLLKHARIEFPTQVCVFSNGTDNAHVPQCLRDRVVILKALVEGSQTVLVTSYVAGQKPAFVRQPSDYLHLPVDLPITVSAYTDEDETHVPTVENSAAKCVTTVFHEVNLHSRETNPQLEVEKESNGDAEIFSKHVTGTSFREELEQKFNLSMNRVANPPDTCVAMHSTATGGSKPLGGADCIYARLTPNTLEQKATSHYDAPSFSKKPAVSVMQKQVSKSVPNCSMHYAEIFVRGRVLRTT